LSSQSLVPNDTPVKKAHYAADCLLRCESGH